MDSNQKRTLREIGRWLRVGTLTVTTLGPAIGTLTAFLRQRTQATDSPIRTQDHRTLSQQQEKLQAIGSALSEVLSDLKQRPESLELLKRGEELAEALVERGTDLSHLLTQRSSEISHQVLKRSSEVTHELKKRGRQATQELAEQDTKFWIALGFSLGLTVAGIVTFRLIRRRLQQEPEEDTLIELAYPNSQNGSIQPLRTPIATPHPTVPVTPFTEQNASTSSVAERTAAKTAAANAAPADAVFIGVTSSKRYYPIETPLDQLALPGGTAVDVLYFTSENEAQAQGFSPAE